MQREVPVVLFVFNRTKQLEETLKCLKGNSIKKLFVFADGSRNAEDVAGVMEVRAMIDSIKWVEVVKHYSNRNKGLSESIQSGLDEVFKHHDTAIIIEDDVCVAPNFYSYICHINQLY